MHVSRGLLPDAERPHCRVHGLSMELVDCDVPMLVPGAVRGKGKWSARKIYRCRHIGCYSVWNGPCQIYTTKRDSSYETIFPGWT